LLLTLPLWQNSAILLVFKTFAFDPSGIIARAALILIAFVCIWSLIKFAHQMSDYSKLLRPLVAAKKRSEPDTIPKILDLKSVKPKPILMMGPFALIALAMPICMALLMDSGMNGGLHLIKENGKLRYSTRQEDIKMTISEMEKRGVFLKSSGK
jgi:hypothetical protein